MQIFAIFKLPIIHFVNLPLHNPLPPPLKTIFTCIVFNYSWDSMLEVPVDIGNNVYILWTV